MKYLSLFSGIGGFELGIKQAYDVVNRHKKQGEPEVVLESVHQPSGELLQGTPTCIGFSEIDKYATKIYQSHFPYEICNWCKQAESGLRTEEGRIGLHDKIGGVGNEEFNCNCKHKPYGDITKINAEELPDFDLLVGGFPCQAFSIAGKRKGFEDTRGTLFFEIARILRAKQPRLFLLENVKGLLSHDNGQTFATIISTLDELGYDLQWQVINSKNHGVPQNRERVFIVGHSRGTSRPEVFPFGHDSREIDGVSGQHSNTLTTRYYGGQANGTYVLESELDAQEIKQIVGGSQGNRIYDPSGISTTLASQAGGLGAKTGLYEIEDMKIRRLTPTECERLQGFPDGWTEGVSDSQRYKTLGNAVTVNVIQAVMEKLI